MKLATTPTIQDRVPEGTEDFRRIFTAGFVATVTMLMANFVLHVAGIAAPRYGMLLGSILNPQAPLVAYSGMWCLGMVSVFLFGTVVLSFLYDYLSSILLPGTTGFGKGVIYGAVTGLLVCLVVAPLAGDGLFFYATAHPIWTSLSTFLGTLVYGVSLESLSRPDKTLELPQEIIEKRAA